MGGALGVAVRYERDGNVHEVMIDRWTNDFPWRFMQPGFLTQGKEFYEFVDEAKPNGEWPNARLMKQITRSEYGIVLIDMINRAVYSRNDYTHPGSHLVSAHSTAFLDTAVNLVALQKLGWIKDIALSAPKFSNASLDIPKTIKIFEDFLEWNRKAQLYQTEWLKRHKIKNFSMFSDLKEREALSDAIRRDLPPPAGVETILSNTIVVSLSDVAMKIDHDTERYPPLSEVKVWLKLNGWKTPINSKSFKQPDYD